MALNPRILVVPQTDRNALDFARIFQKLPGFEIEYVRNCLFGDHIDIARVKASLAKKIHEPEFLITDGSKLKGYQRAMYMAKNHRRFIRFLKEINPDIVITGSDSTGIGRWTVFAARKAGFHTLTVQEGCRHLIDFDKLSLWFGLKAQIAKCCYSISFPPAKYSTEFLEAEYVALWGEYNKKKVLATGRLNQTIFVTGSQTAQIRLNNSTRKTQSQQFTLSFLDTPYSVTPNGTYNMSSINQLRKQLIEYVSEAGVNLYYRPHPLTRDYEMESILSIISQFPNVKLCSEGTAEEWIQKSDACATAPSTCILLALAAGIPLVQMKFRIKGWGKQFWDPVEKYQAGITINNPVEIISAISIIKSDGWLEKYLEQSRIAVEDMVGPLDGKAHERLAEALNTIIAAKR